MKNWANPVLLLLNLLTLFALLYFTFSNYYSWTTHSVWLNPSYSSYEIRSDVKFLIVLGTIFPILLALSKKKFIWLFQSLLIILLITNFESDFLQKTIFINQPTSIQKTNRVVEKLISESEIQLNQIIKEVNQLHADSIDLAKLNKQIAKENFIILSVHLENKNVKCISITAKVNKINFHSFNLQYFPENYELSYYTIKPTKFGENLFVLHSGRYYYTSKWLIDISGITSG